MCVDVSFNVSCNVTITDVLQDVYYSGSTHILSLSFVMSGIKLLQVIYSASHNKEGNP